MAIIRRILLKKNTSNSIKRLIVVAENIDDSVTEYIFKYYRKPLNYLDNSGIRDSFVAVCNASDLQNLPIGSPDPDSNNYFRSNKIDNTYVSAVEAEIAWKEIEIGVQALIDEIKATDRLGVESQEIIGDTTSPIIRTFNINSILLKLGSKLAFDVGSILKKCHTLSYGVEGSIGTYDELELDYTSDALLLATTDLSFGCRCTLSANVTKTFSIYCDIGRIVKFYNVDSVLKGTNIKNFNTNGILRSQLIKTYSVNATLI